MTTNGKSHVGATYIPERLNEAQLYRGRWRPGVPIILPSETAGYSWTTTGTALDYRIRYFFDLTPVNETVAWHGAQLLYLKSGEAFEVFTVFRELSELIEKFLGVRGSPRKKLTDKGEETLARACYVLALFEQCFRSPIGDHWPIAQLESNARLSDVMALCSPNVTKDIVQLAKLFANSHSFLLSEKNFILNPTFTGSPGLGGADADLIVGKSLIDIKSSKANELKRRHILQLLGYSLADWDDKYELEKVGFYYARQGVSIQWQLEELCAISSLKGWSVSSARREFRKIVLPLEPKKGEGFTINFTLDL